MNQTTGVATFTAVSGASAGNQTPITYQVTDITGQTDSATLIATVASRPDAVNDVPAAGAYDTNQSISVLTNDSKDSVNGVDWAATPVSFVCPVSGATTCTSTSVVIPGQGSYSVSNGVVTFDPDASFSGTVSTPITYQVTDSLGQTDTATLSPRVIPPSAPVARDETTTTLAGSPATFTPILGNGGLATGTSLQSSGASAPCLVATGTTSPSTGCVSSLTTTEGSWSISGSGVVTFTPVGNPTGTITPVNYRVTDITGQTDFGTLTVEIPPPPVASNDYSQSEENSTQFVSLLGNDRPGTPSANLVPSTIQLQCPVTGASSCSSTTIVIPNEGTYSLSVNGSTAGLLTFVPAAGFVGSGTVLTYSVADNLGQTDFAQVTVNSLPKPAPSLVPDVGTAAFGQPVYFTPWLNDSAGVKPNGALEPTPSLLPSSIKLCEVNQSAPNCTASVVTTDDGTYAIQSDNRIKFIPASGFYGLVTNPVTYQLTNNWSGASGPQTGSSVLLPTIASPGSPVALDDVRETTPSTSIAIEPLLNDLTGSGVIVTSSIRLCGENEIAPACTQTSVVTDEGSFILDLATGSVNFTPGSSFTNTRPANVVYVVTDTNNLSTFAKIVITIPPTTVISPGLSGLAQTGLNALGPVPFVVVAIFTGITMVWYSRSNIRGNQPVTQPFVELYSMLSKPAQPTVDYESILARYVRAKSEDDSYSRPD